MDRICQVMIPANTSSPAASSTTVEASTTPVNGSLKYSTTSTVEVSVARSKAASTRRRAPSEGARTAARARRHRARDAGPAASAVASGPPTRRRKT